MEKTLDNLIEDVIKEKNQGCSHWCVHDLIAQLYIIKKMEKVKEAKRLLFLGKVSQVIGFDKTAELLKEVEKEIKKGI